MEYFNLVVEQTCSYLRSTFPELSELNWRVEEVPELTKGDSLARYAIRKATMTIILYRIPIERLAHRGADARAQIEQSVLSAAGELIDIDPWELIHPN
jgi:hypothetical protein